MPPLLGRLPYFERREGSGEEEVERREECSMICIRIYSDSPHNMQSASKQN